MSRLIYADVGECGGFSVFMIKNHIIQPRKSINNYLLKIFCPINNYLFIVFINIIG